MVSHYCPLVSALRFCSPWLYITSVSLYYSPWIHITVCDFTLLFVVSHLILLSARLQFLSTNKQAVWRSAWFMVNNLGLPRVSIHHLERYCGFGKIREDFIFANSIKRHISDVKKSRLRQGLPISINDRVIFPFREGFIFTKLRICEVLRK